MSMSTRIYCQDPEYVQSIRERLGKSENHILWPRTIKYFALLGFVIIYFTGTYFYNYSLYNDRWLEAEWNKGDIGAAIRPIWSVISFHGTMLMIVMIGWLLQRSDHAMLVRYVLHLETRLEVMRLELEETGKETK